MNYLKILKLSLITLSLILYVSCDIILNKRNKELKYKTENYNRLTELELNSLSSKKIIDTIFLSYRFGMSQNEVFKHTSDLFEKGKLKKNYKGKYYFEIDSKIGTKYQGIVFAEYFDNKLFSIGLVFEDPNPILVFSQLSDLYEEKYNACDYMDNPNEELSIFNKIWLKDNLKIVIHTGTYGTSVNYIDLRFEKQKKHNDSLDNQLKTEELKKEL